MANVLYKSDIKDPLEYGYIYNENGKLTPRLSSQANLPLDFPEPLNHAIVWILPKWRFGGVEFEMDSANAKTRNIVET